jgi:hypothetical protein
MLDLFRRLGYPEIESVPAEADRPTLMRESGPFTFSRAISSRV